MRSTAIERRSISDISEFRIFKVTHNANLDIPPSNILIDTGASANIVTSEMHFEHFDNHFNEKDTYLELADGSRHTNIIMGRGTAKIPIADKKGKVRKVILHNALFIPTFSRNIMSLSSAVRNGASFNLNTPGKEHMISNGHIFKISNANNLYTLNSVSIVNSVVSRSAAEWHRIFGHVNHEDISKLPNGISNLKISNKTVSKELCEPCVMGKMERQFKRVQCPRADIPFISVFCDLNGPIKEECDYKYVFGVIDDYSGYLAIYLMKNKSESPRALNQFLADHAIYGVTKKLRSDSGGEFNSHTFKQILVDSKIKFETCAPHSAFQNGRIERSWKTLFNMARAILFDSKVPIKLYPYILKHAVYIMNRTYSEYLQKTPLEAALKKKPDAHEIHMFGSLCYGYQHHTHKTKFQARAKPAVYIGKDPISPAYLLYYPIEDTIRRTRSVKFNEVPTMFYNSKSDNVENQSSLNPINDVSDLERPSEQPADRVISEESMSRDLNPTRYPQRPRNIPNRLGIEDLDLDSICSYFYVMSLIAVDKTNVNVPNSYSEAVNSNEREFWIKAMDAELCSLLANDTWDLVYLPPGQKCIGGRWVYVIKCLPTGDNKFKARYCAKGFSQRPGVNYDLTYAPTAKMPTVRMLIDFAKQFNLILHQLDVNNAYLNSTIDYDIYMRQPEGYIQDPSMVCKLRKSIYGLKQSAMLWNNTLLGFMKQQNLSQSMKDPCLFIRKDTFNMLYVLIWVDDIIVAASNNKILQEFKSNFAKSFKIKDIGPLTWFLGIEFCQSNDYISMNQKLYINNILARFGMTNCKPRSLPCDPNVHNILNDYSPVYDDPTHYRELVGSLIYLYCCTRPDLSFVVSLLSRYMAEPKVIHLQIANGVLHYLKYTVNYDLKYVKSNEPLRVFGYTDSDFAQSSDRQSISGYCFKLNLNSALISWRSAKQTIVALSTTEAEYIAAGEAVKEALFLRELFAEFNNKLPATVTLFCDNQGALALATNNQQFHKRTKHIGVAFHAIRTYAANKSIHLTYVASKDNLADMFTKPLNGFKLKSFAIIRGSVEKLDA